MNVRTLSVIFNFFMIALAFAAMNFAQAQEVQVKSANPNSALQGTVDLEVEISGSGFDTHPLTPVRKIHAFLSANGHSFDQRYDYRQRASQSAGNGAGTKSFALCAGGSPVNQRHIQAKLPNVRR